MIIQLNKLITERLGCEYTGRASFSAASRRIGPKFYTDTEHGQWYFIDDPQAVRECLLLVKKHPTGATLAGSGLRMPAPHLTLPCKMRLFSLAFGDPRRNGKWARWDIRQGWSDKPKTVIY